MTQSVCKAFGYPVAEHWGESRNVQFRRWDSNRQHISPESNVLPTEPPRFPQRITVRSAYLLLLPLGWEPLHPSLEYLTFETCAWKPAYLSSAACIQPFGIYCVCALDIELFSAIIRNTQVCVNILYSFTLYQGFLPSPGTLKCV